MSEKAEKQSAAMIESQNMTINEMRRLIEELQSRLAKAGINGDGQPESGISSCSYPAVRQMDLFKESEERYEALFDRSLCAIFLHDFDGCFYDANEAALRLFGCGRRDMAFLNLISLLDEDHALSVRAYMKEVREKGFLRSPVEWRFRKKNGEYVWIEVEGSLVYRDGAPYAIQGVARDISQSRKTAEELKRLTEELARSNSDLKQFAYAASHDLQAPLRSIEGFVKLLMKNYRGRLDEKADEFIHFIVDGVRNMQVLIRDLLEYSQVGTKGRRLRPVESVASMKKAMENLKAAIEESKASVIFQEEKLPPIIGDPSQLNRLFQNLIDNAIKFRSGKPPEVRIEADRDGNEWVFSVTDNGIGIEGEDAERVFAVFKRLHSGFEYPGTGIGLALCKKIVERHGGRIWVESEAGTGSTFFFTLPAINEEFFKVTCPICKKISYAPSRETFISCPYCNRNFSPIYGVDRRVERRVAHAEKISCTFKGNTFDGVINDISSTGLSASIPSNLPILPGDIWQLSMRDLSVNAKVMWVREEQNSCRTGLKKDDDHLTH